MGNRIKAVKVIIILGVIGVVLGILTAFAVALQGQELPGQDQDVGYRHPDMQGTARVRAYEAWRPYTFPPLWFACDVQPSLPDKSADIRSYVGYSRTNHLFPNYLYGDNYFNGYGEVELYLSQSAEPTYYTGNVRDIGSPGVIETGFHVDNNGLVVMETKDIVDLILSDPSAKYLHASFYYKYDWEQMAYQISGIHRQLCSLSYACGIVWLNEAACSTSAMKAGRPPTDPPKTATDLIDALVDFLSEYIMPAPVVAVPITPVPGEEDPDDLDDHNDPDDPDDEYEE